MATTSKRDPEAERDLDWLADGRLIPLVFDADALAEQCEHANAAGHYVVRVLPGVRAVGKKRWHAFDPSTKLQVLSWIGGVEQRRRRVHWLCAECERVMPLGSYDAE